MTRTQRGATLIEVLMTLAVVVVGMLGLFKAISAANQGSSAAQRFLQGQARAQQVIEAIRNAPATPLNVLQCLAQKGSAATVADWTVCEVACLNDLQVLSVAASAQGCVFSTLGNSAQDQDRTQQKYRVVFDPDDPQRSSWVQNPPPAPLACLAVPCRLFDIQVTIGWNDSGSSDPNGEGGHRITMRQAVFQ